MATSAEQARALGLDEVAVSLTEIGPLVKRLVGTIDEAKTSRRRVTVALVSTYLIAALSGHPKEVQEAVDEKDLVWFNEEASLHLSSLIMARYGPRSGEGPALPQA
jgi:muramidase (phage lysozyme)